MIALTEHFVSPLDGRDGRLCVRHGPRNGKPMLLFLHGYPDSQRCWQETMLALAEDFFVVSFDWPGVAGSRPAVDRSRYAIASLLGDIEAVVVDSGYESFHLVGHDWGSTIGWSYVAHPVYGDRVVSFTSISGPHLGMWLHWIATSLRSGEWVRIRRALAQVIKSSYVLGLLAFPLTELFWLVGGVRVWRLVLRLAGVPKGDPLLDETRDVVLSLTLRPVSLYRRNVLSPPPVPPEKGIACPAQILLSTADPFVSPASVEAFEPYVQRCSIEKIDASHWVQRTHQEQVAACIARFAAQHTAGDAPNGSHVGAARTPDFNTASQRR